MSNIDNRIVEMQFDNKQFEHGVRETMSTLDKLKQSLKLENVDDGFKKLGQASDDAKKKVKGFDDISLSQLAGEITGINKAVGELKKRFTAVGEEIDQFKRKFIGTVKEMTVGQISNGFNKYAQTTEAVHTLMSTLGEGSKNSIYDSINDLNEYSDATSYDLASMTQNLSMFVNAGNGLDDSAMAIKGIGNAAALAGVSVQDTNRVMKNFSDAMAAGKMQAIDWKSLELFKFTSKPIKEEFIETAKAMKILDKEGWILDKNGKRKVQVTYENLRDTLRYDWMTKDVIIETLKKYSDLEGANKELAQKAFEAAKVARTYGEAMDAVKDAVSTGWMHVFEKIFGDVDEAAKLWTSVSDTLIDRLSSPFFTWMDNILSTWKGLGGREKMIRIFSEMADMLFGLEDEVIENGVLVNGVLTEGTVTTSNVLSALLNAWRTVFGAIDGTDLLMLTEKIRAAFVNLHEWMNRKNEKGVSVWDDLFHILQGVFSVIKGIYEFAKSIVSGVWKGLVGPLSDGTRNLLDILGDLGLKIFDVFNKYLGDGSVFKTITDGIASIVNVIASLIFGTGSSELPDWLKESRTIFDVINDIANSDLVKRIEEIGKNIWGFLKDNLPNAFKLAASIIQWFAGTIAAKAKYIRDFAARLFELIKTSEKFKTLKENIVKYASPVIDFFSRLKNKAKEILGSKDPFKVLSDSVAGLVNRIKSTGLYQNLSKVKNSIVETIKSANPLGTAWAKIKEIFGSLGEKFKTLKKTITDFFAEKDILGALTTWITGLWSTVKEKVSEFFANLGTTIKEKFKELVEKIKTGGDPSKSFAANIFDRIKSGLETAREKFKSFLYTYLPKVKSLLGRVGEFVLGLFISKAKADDGSDTGSEEGPSLFSRIINKLKSGYEKLKAFLQPFLDTYMPKLKAIWDKVKHFLFSLFISTAKADDGSEVVESTEGNSMFGGILESISRGFNLVKEKLSPIITAIKDFFTNIFGSLFGNGENPGSLTSGLDTVKTFFVNVGMKVKEIANSIGITDLQSFIDKAGIFAGSLSGLYVFTNIGRTFGSIASIGKSSSKVIKSFTKVTKSWASVTKSLKKPLGGLLDSITGLITGTKESSKSLWEALSGAVTGNGEATQGVFGAIKDYISAMVDPSKGVLEQLPEILKGNLKNKAKKVDSWGTSLLKIAGTLLIVAGTFYLLGRMSPTEIEAGKNAIILIGSAFSIFAIVMAGIVKNIGGEDFGKAGSAVLKIAAAIAILGVAVYAMGKLSTTEPEVIKQGLIIVAILGVFILVMQHFMAKAAKLKGNNSAVGGVLSAALAILLLSLPIKRLGKMDRNVLSQGIIALTALMGILGIMQLFQGYAAKLGEGNKIKGVIPAAIAIWLLSIPVRKLGKMDLGQLVQGGVAVAVLGGILVGMQALQKKISAMKGGASDVGGVIATTVAIMLLGITAVGLGLIPRTLLSKGVVTILELAGIIAGLQFVMAGAARLKGNNQTVGGVLSTVLGIVALAAVVVVLGLTPSGVLKKGVTALIAIGAVLAVLQLTMALLSKFANVKGIVSAIVAAALVVVLVKVLASAFVEVKDVPTDTMIAFAGTLVGIFGTIATVIGVMSFIPWHAGIQAATILGSFLVVLAGAFSIAAGIATSGMSSLNTMIFTLGSVLGTFSDLTDGKSAESAKKMVEDISSMIGDIVAVAGIAGEIETFKTAVTRIGNGLKGFSIAISGIDPQKSTDAIKMAMDINTIVMLLKASGVENFPDMAVGIGYLGAALALYADEVSGIEIPTDAKFDPEALKSTLEGIATALPSDDMLGTFSEIASTEEGSKGDQLVKFALGMEAIKSALQSYADTCVDLPIEAVGEANKALSEIAALTANIPGSEKFSWNFLGHEGTVTLETQATSLEDFAEDVTALSTGLENFVAATEGIDTDKVTTAVDTLNALSLIEPPDKPGLLDFLTGKGSLESFATQMTYLADGFAKYAEKTGADNLNYGNIEKSRTVIEQLAEVQNLIDPDGGLMGVIGGTKKEAFAGLAANMEGLGSGVAAFCKNLNEDNPNFSNTDKAIGVIQSFGEVYNKLPNIGGFFSWFSGDVKLEDFANKIPLLGTAIAGFANSLGDATLGDNVQQAADYIDKFARIQSKIKTPGDMQLDTFAGQIQQSITRLVEINRTVSAEGFSFNDDAFNKMIGYLTSFKDIAVQMRDFKTNENVDFKKFGEQIKGFFEELQKLATDYGVLGAKSFNDEKLKNMTDGIKAPFEAFRDAFNSLKEASTGDLSLSSLVTQILNDGLTALKDEGKKAEYKDAGASLVESIQNGVKSKNINTETSNIAIEGSNEVKTDKDIWDSYVSAGKYLVDGLAEGLKNWDSAVEAAKKLAQEVLSTIQNTTDEHSPSKKTMEYGMYLSEGLAIGIEKYGFMANTAAGNIARMVLGTMDRTISNHDTSYDFGIAPVLDSSNIGTYTNTLAQYRSEWDTVNRMHLPAVSKIAESMDVNVNDRYANTMESFRSDIADLGDRITSMRVVMDTGTVVGELAPGMDAALGRRANYSMRRIS